MKKIEVIEVKNNNKYSDKLLKLKLEEAFKNLMRKKLEISLR